MCGKLRRLLLVIFVTLAVAMPTSRAFAQAVEHVAAQSVENSDAAARARLGHATMCERVENLTPTRAGLVFSVSAGQVCCFTSFDPVPQPSLVYHRWFHRDELSTQTKLRIYPPKWATYSVIQLRETDKGPWRGEVTDQNGRVYSVLRFSIVD